MPGHSYKGRAAGTGHNQLYFPVPVISGFGSGNITYTVTGVVPATVQVWTADSQGRPTSISTSGPWVNGGSIAVSANTYGVFGLDSNGFKVTAFSNTGFFT
jgi:hypothetical protein